MEQEDLNIQIQRLKKEKDAVILAHYYVNEEVQNIADYIGDSYYLSELAVKLPNKVICFAGVRFMGESAKLLNPEKTVLLPEPEADCPMAHMVDIDKITELRKEYVDLAVVCYINSQAAIKIHADVCVTSANALKIVKSLPNKNICFIPDENLGRYIASKVPDKHFIFNDGYCHVHNAISKEALAAAKEIHPDAKIAAHPECPSEILSMADYVGSTSGIIEYTAKNASAAFIICTEIGVLYELKKRNPEKSFYFVDENPICPDMKKITLQKIYTCLSQMTGEVQMNEQDMQSAKLPLQKMLELAK